MLHCDTNECFLGLCRYNLSLRRSVSIFWSNALPFYEDVLQNMLINVFLCICIRCVQKDSCGSMSFNLVELYCLEGFSLALLSQKSSFPCLTSISTPSVASPENCLLKILLKHVRPNHSTLTLKRNLDVFFFFLFPLYSVFLCVLRKRKETADCYLNFEFLPLDNAVCSEITDPQYSSLLFSLMMLEWFSNDGAWRAPKFLSSLVFKGCEMHIELDLQKPRWGLDCIY